jgi:two-component system OmpR family sensor kinase
LRVEEKSILIRFVSFYHISTFILLSVIALLIYNMQYQSIYNLTVSNLETLSVKISTRIITSAMKNESLDFNDLCIGDREIRLSMYNKENKIIFSDLKLPININLDKKSYLQDDFIIVVNKTALGHLGVYSIVMIDELFREKVNSVLITILIGFISFYIAICAIGFYMMQLFMKPIKNERIRLDNFIKDTTHELNTPITALMICSDKQTPRSEKNMERIYLSAKRISEIYKDLTHLFLETDKKKNIQKIQLDKLISQELEYFELLASKKNILTTLDIEETHIKIDSEDFKRIFSNIFSNAIKYNNRGGNISVILKDKHLIIEDNGIGISIKNKKNIFNRYYRATTQDGGFGMGLNIVYKICKDYGITINVESKLKFGTTFSFDFNPLEKKN